MRKATRLKQIARDKGFYIETKTAHKSSAPGTLLEELIEFPPASLAEMERQVKAMSPDLTKLVSSVYAAFFMPDLDSLEGQLKDTQTFWSVFNQLPPEKKAVISKGKIIPGRRYEQLETFYYDFGEALKILIEALGKLPR